MNRKKISLKKKVITFASAIMLSLVPIGATSFSVASAESFATTEVTTESNTENLKSTDCSCSCVYCNKSNEESAVTTETTTNEPNIFEEIVGLILTLVFIALFIV